MNFNAANQRPSQPESGTDRKANKDPSTATHSIFSFHPSDDTKHQVPKQTPSKTDKRTGGPLFGGLNSQNNTSQSLNSPPFDSFAPQRKSTDLHAILQKETLSPQNNSENKVNFSSFKSEALYGQPKLATVNEAKPTFTGMQNHPHLNVMKFPIPGHPPQYSNYSDIFYRPLVMHRKIRNRAQGSRSLAFSKYRAQFQSLLSNRNLIPPNNIPGASRILV